MSRTCAIPTCNTEAEDRGDCIDYCPNHHYLSGSDGHRWQGEQREVHWRRTVVALLMDLIQEMKSLNETMTDMAVDKIKDSVINQ